MTEVQKVKALTELMSKNPSALIKQSMDLLDKAEDPRWDINDFSVVREALEQLQQMIDILHSNA